MKRTLLLILPLVTGLACATEKVMSGGFSLSKPALDADFDHVRNRAAFDLSALPGFGWAQNGGLNRERGTDLGRRRRVSVPVAAAAVGACRGLDDCTGFGTGRFQGESCARPCAGAPSSPRSPKTTLARVVRRAEARTSAASPRDTKSLSSRESTPESPSQPQPQPRPPSKRHARPRGQLRALPG